MARNLDLTQLRAFYEVAEQNGVTRAADRLHLTQSAVSMQIKRLEDSLGFAVFDRDGRRMVLTAEGETLHSYARRMLALNDEVLGRLTADRYEGEIMLGVPHDIVYPHIPAILRDFARDYPKVKVQLVSSYSRQLVDLVSEGSLHLTLTTEPERGAGGSYLCSRNLVWVGAKGGRAWRGDPLRLAAAQHCIFRKIAVAELEAMGRAWEMAVVTQNDMSVSASLSADLGVEVRIEGYIHNDHEVIDHKGHLPALPQTHINLYQATQSPNPLADRLADYIRSAYAGQVASQDAA